MGLNIAQYKKNGNTFTNAYAKVSGVNYNNDTKIAVFSVSVHPAKGETNTIQKFNDYYTKVESTDNVIVKCYSRIQSIISQIKAQIASLEAKKLEIVDDENAVLKIEAQIAQLQKNDILQLEGATEL